MASQEFTLFCQTVNDALSPDNSKLLSSQKTLTALRDKQPYKYVMFITQYLKNTSPYLTVDGKCFVATQLRRSLSESTVSQTILAALDKNAITELVKQLTALFLDASMDASVHKLVAYCVGEFGSSLLKHGL